MTDFVIWQDNIASDYYLNLSAPQKSDINHSFGIKEITKEIALSVMSEKIGGAYHVFRAANSSSSGACNWGCGNNTARNSGLDWRTAIRGLWGTVETSLYWLTCTRWPILLLKVDKIAKVKNQILLNWSD